MKTLLRLVFELRGSFDPSLVTHEVTLEPSEAWRKGDKGKFKALKQYDYWCLDSGYINTLDISEVSGGIYDKLKQKKTEFSKLISVHELTVVFSVIAKIDRTNTPSISFSEEIVKLASEFGASFDIDLYLNTDGDA